MASYLPSALPGGETTALGSNDLVVVQKSGENLLKRIKWSTLQGLQIPTRLGASNDGTITNANSMLDNGWYLLPAANSGGTNGPTEDNTTPYYIEVMGSGNYTRQVAYAQLGAGVPNGYIQNTWIRVRYNNVWQPWFKAMFSHLEQRNAYVGTRQVGAFNKLAQDFRCIRLDNNETDSTRILIDRGPVTFSAGVHNYTVDPGFENMISVCMAQCVGGTPANVLLYPTATTNTNIQVLARVAATGAVYSGTTDVAIFAMGY
jgi:hypothetical protein